MPVNSRLLCQLSYGGLSNCKGYCIQKGNDCQIRALIYRRRERTMVTRQVRKSNRISSRPNSQVLQEMRRSGDAEADEGVVCPVTSDWSAPVIVNVWAFAVSSLAGD